jgi:sugar fermentation stimulation protein A
MRFQSPLIRGSLLKRYKRFLADVTLETGETITAACPNTGAMLGLTDPGLTVYLSRSERPTRKYPHTWELADLPRWGLTGINTGLPNAIVAEAIGDGKVLSDYSSLRREVKYGVNSRIDILLEDPEKPPCYVEVKNVHLLRQPGLAEFPDCPTERGAKHLAEMSNMVKQGARAVMVYLIQNATPTRFALAGDLDRSYLEAFKKARRAGVEAIALTCDMSLDGVTASRVIEVEEP